MALSLSVLRLRPPLSRRYRFQQLRIVRLERVVRLVVLLEIRLQQRRWDHTDFLRQGEYRSPARLSSSFREALRMYSIRQGQALDLGLGRHLLWVDRVTSLETTALGRMKAALHLEAEGGSRTS